LGVAVSQRVGDKVLVRIARIGSKSTKRGPNPATWEEKTKDFEARDPNKKSVKERAAEKKKEEK
jgi:hypothetical protein